MRKIRRKLCALLLAAFMVVAVLPMSSVSAAGTSTTKVTTTTIWKYQLKAYNESLDLINAIKKDGWRVYYMYEGVYSDYIAFSYSYMKLSNGKYYSFKLFQYVYPKKASRFSFINKSTKENTSQLTQNTAIKYYKNKKFLVENSSKQPRRTPAVIKKTQNTSYNASKDVYSALSSKGFSIISYSCKFSDDKLVTNLSFAKKDGSMFTIKEECIVGSTTRFIFDDKSFNEKRLSKAKTIEYIKKGNIGVYK